MHRSFSASIVLLILLMCPALASAQTNVLFIFDASGSMKVKLPDGQTRLAVAKTAMASLLTQLPAGTRAGLMLYGHRRAKDCTDIQTVAAIGAEAPGAISQRIAGVNAIGETPIAGALKAAGAAFAGLKGQNNRVVLITDGIEECGGDPCPVALDLKNAGVDVKVDVVGFTLNATQQKAIQCVTKNTGGSFYSAADPKGLTAAMAQVKQEIAAPPPVDNPLSTAQGGQILAAPDAGWAAVISGKETDMAKFSCAGLPAEGVFAFKNEAPYTLSSFSILIPSGGQWAKDIELLRADDSPTGTFTSIGKFAIQNMRMIKSPYQEFTFTPVAVRYLKLRILSAYTGDCGDMLTQIRVSGKPVPGAAPTITPAQTTSPNLFATAELLGAPNQSWSRTTSGKEADSGSFSGCGGLPAEGIWGFKGPAQSFSRFSVFIPSRGQWLKDFELQSADAVGGPYKSLGKFTVQNQRLFKTPYQEFTFPKTTAKFLKLRILSAYTGDCGDVLPQLRLQQ